MGVVWRAVVTPLDRDVAIKFLPAAVGDDAERLALQVADVESYVWIYDIPTGRGDRFMSVAITTEPTLSWSAPRQVFQTDFVDTLGRSFDVSSDGQYLYVVKQPDPPDGTRVRVVAGWAP